MSVRTSEGQEKNKKAVLVADDHCQFVNDTGVESTSCGGIGDGVGAAPGGGMVGGVRGERLSVGDVAGQ